MSVKSFKFVSPGVFINEIDNSFIPAEADIIGPVVIGRSRRGLAMSLVLAVVTFTARGTFNLPCMELTPLRRF